jgi:potassium channel subfamily K
MGEKIFQLREEKDYFQPVRKKQQRTIKLKRWYALGLNIFLVGLLLCVGALLFWKTERRQEELSFFNALFFSYTSLLTIGYGNIVPNSNASKPVFVAWPIVTVPIMTTLISHLGHTIIPSFQRGAFIVSDWVILYL